MKNKTKLIVLVILLALVALPYWQIKYKSKFFAEGVLSHLSSLGEWTNSDISTALNGQVTLHNLAFRPTGYRQSIAIDSIQIHTDMKRLLFADSQKLISHIPNNMTLSFRNVKINSERNGDLQSAINRSNYWPMAASYLGAFGCGEGSGPSYSDAQWNQILSSVPNFDVEVSYSLVDDYHIDFNINIESPNNWFIAWSGTLTRPSDVDRISFNETIVDTLYYYHSDQGFNQKRNEVCATANRNSYAAYRLNSAEEIQKYLRVYAGQEMSNELSNQYQRSLEQDVELNAIFKLNNPKYLFEIAGMDQTEFYAQVSIEAAMGENEYQALQLTDIDFLDLDVDTLRAEMEAKQKQAEIAEAEANKPKELLKTITTSIGKNANEIRINDWSQAVGQNIKVRTKRGRPIFGRLQAINDKQLTIVSKYIRGDATITVMRKDVVWMSISR